MDLYFELKHAHVELVNHGHVELYKGVQAVAVKLNISLSDSIILIEEQI